MQVRNLFTDDRAVSPVIGVILMVAITVILAAVIGTFVLGLGDSLQDTSPQASFAGDQGTTTVGGTDVPSLAVAHEGGDSIEEGNLDVTVNGEQAYGVNPSDDTDPTTLWNSTGTVNAGSSVTIVAYSSNDITGANYTASSGEITGTDGGSASGLSGGDTARVIWTSSDGGSSQTLFTRDIN